jgi:CO dehydrogenase maturation factor
MGRASVQGIDALVVVVEPGSRSIETTKNIARMAKELGIKYVATIANKITKGSQIEAIKRELTDTTTLANIRYNPAVQEADLKGEPAFQSSVELIGELKEAKNALMDLLPNPATARRLRRDE